jgi:hypothetical protein
MENRNLVDRRNSNSSETPKRMFREVWNKGGGVGGEEGVLLG